MPPWPPHRRSLCVEGQLRLFSWDSYEVLSAPDIMISLEPNNSEGMAFMSSHITGRLAVATLQEITFLISPLSVGGHVAEYDALFLADLYDGQLPKNTCIME
ncbi:hypothetical protein EJB05_14558 [Eragrostis curvula]|uniref:Uncharacterized protein n=1 Tax=Eragrostis curvula TaxID=38414 RepID=A0A5J9VZJ0_9POAL|nr:hypothetical protein EJB05_14558 [Eragrostis curvula]